MLLSHFPNGPLEQPFSIQQKEISTGKGVFLKDRKSEVLKTGIGKK